MRRLCHRVQHIEGSRITLLPVQVSTVETAEVVLKPPGPAKTGLCPLPSVEGSISNGPAWWGDRKGGLPTERGRRPPLTKVPLPGRGPGEAANCSVDAVMPTTLD
jgi:hypothetical protein